MPKLQPPAPVLLAPEAARTVNSTATLPRIIDLFRVPESYLRSVHLERDFDDITSLRHYVVTPPIVAVFSRIVEGLRPGPVTGRGASPATTALESLRSRSCLPTCSAIR